MSTATMPQIDNQLGLLFQYTVEAYKTFEKLAENLANPMLAAMFAKFATEEREHRDLIELRYAAGPSRIQLTLGGDLRFEDLLKLPSREIVESLIVRERTMAKKLAEAARGGSASDRSLFGYISATKRAHEVLLERELAMLASYPDWFTREDAESLIVHGESR